jgi:hypothetical protein
VDATYSKSEKVIFENEALGLGISGIEMMEGQ